MSSTRRACDLMYSAANREFAENHRLQRERLRSVPVSARRSRSPSVTIPASCPFLSSTGTPRMRRLIMSLATFSTVVSGVVVATARTMTSLALIRLSSRDWGKAIRADDSGLDVDHRNISRARSLVDFKPSVICANKLALNFLSAFLNMRGVRDRTDTCCDFQTNFPRLPGRPFLFAGRTARRDDNYKRLSNTEASKKSKPPERGSTGSHGGARGGVLLGKRRLDHFVGARRTEVRGRWHWPRASSAA